MSGETPAQEQRFQGIAVSPGIARGVIHVVRDDLDDVARYRIQPGDVAGEIGRFEAALIQTRTQILEMQCCASSKASSATWSGFSRTSRRNTPRR
jgi:phosphoenolpyruvate-protein kinase (PTS system EI component)